MYMCVCVYVCMRTVHTHQHMPQGTDETKVDNSILCLLCMYINVTNVGCKHTTTAIITIVT